MKTDEFLTLTAPADYQLRLQGHISADWGDWLAEAQVTWDGTGPAGTTTVTGRVPDQAALFGLLSFVRDLGAPLVWVKWIHFRKEKHESD